MPPRLLALDKETGAVSHHPLLVDLPQFLRPGDCLVLNNSRVLPARLIGHRLPGAGPVRSSFSPTRVTACGSAWCARGGS